MPQRSSPPRPPSPPRPAPEAAPLEEAEGAAGAVPARAGRLPAGWWVGLAGVLIGLAGLGTAYWALRDPPEHVPVPVVSESGAVAGGGSSVWPQQEPAAPEPAASALSGKRGHSQLLQLDIPTGFAPPRLQSLSFADAFAQAAAYRGWHCLRSEVILFSDARQALPAVQEHLLAQGYQVEDAPAALGEDQGWLARHPEQPDLFGSFSTGAEGRGNVSLCKLGS